MKGIVLSSIGTKDMEVYKNSIENIYWELKNKYPDYYIVNSFSSDEIRNKALKNDIKISSFPEALFKIEEAGIRDITVLGLYGSKGAEFEKIEKQGKVFNNNHRLDIKFTTPLVSDLKDVDEIVDLFIKVFSDKPTIFIVDITKELSEIYSKMEEKLEKKNIFLMDKENFKDNIKKINLDSKEIRVISLLAISKEEVDDDNRDSLVSNLANLGFVVEIDKRGLVEFEDIKNFYYKKVDNLI